MPIKRMGFICVLLMGDAAEWQWQQFQGAAARPAYLPATVAV
jgi:hypothetical protein